MDYTGVAYYSIIFLQMTLSTLFKGKNNSLFINDIIPTGISLEVTFVSPDSKSSTVSIITAPFPAVCMAGGLI